MASGCRCVCLCFDGLLGNSVRGAILHQKPKCKKGNGQKINSILCVPETPDNHSCSSNPTVDDKLRNTSFNPAIVIRSFDNINNGRVFQMGWKYLLAHGIFFPFSRGTRHDGATRAALRLENIFITEKKKEEARDRFYASQLESELLHKSTWPRCNEGTAFSLRMSASNISFAALVSLYIKGKAFKTFSFPLHT